MNTRKQIRRKQLAQQQRRNRLLVIGGIALVAIIVVVFLILQTPRPSNTAAIIIPTKPASWPQAAANALGPADAKVVVSEFADFQCPVCNDFHISIWPQIISQYVATGKVRFEYHHFIVIDGNVGGVESRQAAEASECASEQNMFWDYATILFANQQSEGSGTFGNDRLKTMAADIGLDTAKFNACFDSHKDASLVVADEGKATSAGLNATPSVLVNGKLVQNPLDFNQVKAAIDAALK